MVCSAVSLLSGVIYPYIYIYAYIHTYIYIYIYIYILRCLECSTWPCFGEGNGAGGSLGVWPSKHLHKSYEEITRLAETRLAQNSLNYITRTKSGR